MEGGEKESVHKLCMRGAGKYREGVKSLQLDRTKSAKRFKKKAKRNLWVQGYGVSVWEGPRRRGGVNVGDCRNYFFVTIILMVIL